ncbi:MAG: redoxin domain-containing protein [Legionellales bacterium]|jgi:hypothetical protein|nr:redoxin domain-containing protein [Legionellales bacterium]
MRILSYLVAFFLVCGVVNAMPNTTTSGMAALNFTLQDVSGKNVSLDKYYGKVIVLEWRDPRCKFVQKHYKSQNMQSLQQKYTQNNDVIWLTILLGTNSDSEHSFATNELLDPAREVTKLYNITKAPEVVIIDKAGYIAYIGAVDSLRTAVVEDIERTKINYIVNSLDAIISHSPVSVSHTRPYGCDVTKFKPAPFKAV